MSRGYCGAQDTFYVGTLKGVGRVYQQPFIDTYTKVGFAKLYDRKTPITAADLLNDRVIPFYEAHNVPLKRILTVTVAPSIAAPTTATNSELLPGGRKHRPHPHQAPGSPQTNGIVERFHKTMLDT